MTGNDDATTTGEPIGYSAVTRGNASPMFCVDCGEDVNREVEPMTSDDMEAFDTAKCALCGATFYPPEEAVDLPFDPTDEEFEGDGQREHALVPGNVLDAVDETNDPEEAFRSFARFLDERERAGYPHVSVSEVGHAVLLVLEELEKTETVEVHGSEVPKPLAEFYRDDLSGLIAVDPDAPDGVLVYESASRVGGRPAVEVPHSDPHLVDESDVPGGTTPPMSFSDLVRKYGLAFEVVDDYTYVYVPERED